jgi:hypothetical protein
LFVRESSGAAACSSCCQQTKNTWFRRYPVNYYFYRECLNEAHYQFSIRFARATMAWTNSLVDAVPPRSPVRTFSISFTFGIRFKSAIVAPAKLHQEYFLAKACLTSVSKDLR